MLFENEKTYGYMWESYGKNSTDGQYHFYSSVEDAKKAFDNCESKEKTYGTAIADEGSIVPYQLLGTTL